MTSADALATHEIVLAKRSSYHVPAMCPGCGGAVELVRKLAQSTLRGRVSGGGLTLRVGFCRPCSDAYTRRGRAASWVALAAAAVSTMAGAAVIAAPPTPPVVLVAVPCILTALAISLLQRRWGGGTGPSSREGTPYRTAASAPTSAVPAVPIQLKYRDGSSALLYCADAGWAADFARVNELVLRRAATLPRLPFLGFAAATAMSLAALCGVGAWHFQWPVLVLDNAAPAPITIFLDGASRWRVPVLRGRDLPLEVRIPRGRHRITHQLDSSSSQVSDVEVVVDGVLARHRKLYDPLASGCYHRYPVVYGPARASEPGYLPPTRVVELKADHLFRDAPESVSLEKGRSEIHWVVVRDENCFDTARGAAFAAVAAP